jgi:predicted membrane protein
MPDENKPIDAEFTETPREAAPTPSGPPSAAAPPPPPPPRRPPVEDGADGEPGEDPGRRGKKGKTRRERKPRVFSTGRAVFGLIVISFGVLMLLASLGIHIGDVSKLIALGMIAFGILKVLGPQPASSKLFGATLILIGVFLLFDWWNMWPLLVILFGFHILWRSVGKKGVRQMGSTSTTADYAREFVVFGSSEKILKTDHFKGGEFTAIFGGVELDLRDADIPAGQDAVIDCFVVFGGVELKVPEHWEVVNEAAAIFGGVEEKSAKSHASPDSIRRVHIKGYVLFGGLEIRN